MTKRQQEKQVLDRIKEYKGFTIFWATEYQQRAFAVQRLQDRGRIIRHQKAKWDHYPWMVFTIRKSNEH
ncbi:MAG TPA: hypothetical protein VI911_10610 [Patescibacteria group bacterium]|nr:hypothetical protein [Patescibacteria group bacterium]